MSRKRRIFGASLKAKVTLAAVPPGTKQPNHRGPFSLHRSLAYIHRWILGRAVYLVQEATCTQYPCHDLQLCAAMTVRTSLL